MHSSEKVILFNDIVGSTKLWGKYGDKMYNELNRITTKVNKLLKVYTKSFIIKTIGDSFMICFDTIYDALDFAVKLNSFLINTKSKLDVRQKVQFRTGIYSGIVNEKKIKIQNCIVKDFFGTPVNIASRLESKVSIPDSIAIGIHSNRDVYNIQNFLKDNDYSYEVDNFKKKCNLKTKTKNIITKCKTIRKLKGINKEIKVLLIKRKIEK